MSTALLTVTVLGSCAPPYVWGSNEQVEKNLLRIVPVGSSTSILAKAAESRGWEINRINIRVSDGGRTYFDDTHLRCSGVRGGKVVPALIDEYNAPFVTSVETLWIFDARQKLDRVCVRKTVDAL